MVAPSGSRRIEWRPGPLDADFLVDAGHVSLQSLRPHGQPFIEQSIKVELEHALPINQIRLLGEGSLSGTSERLVSSPTSQRLIYDSHTEWTEEPGAAFLEIVTHDPTTRIQVRGRYCVFAAIPILRSTVIVENQGLTDVFLQSAASLSLGFLNRGHEKWWEEYEIVIANNTNFREAQWQKFDLPDLGMDYVGASDFDKPGTRAAIIKSSLGTFSTVHSLPMGALSRKDGKQCYMWQIEHSGSWRWELGNIVQGLYLVAGGPTDQDHHWTRRLMPTECFTSVTTAIAVASGNTESAFGPFTEYRRRIRRSHADNEKLPIIFNDYMNCLKGDPTEEKIRALIEPARKCGAEYFCIDAGWYADEPGWWDSVGTWEPSTVRFPGGLKALLDQIRCAGMIPGLWIEPEVIGINSPVAKLLPDTAFFQRGGVRIVEQSRYQLDFRSRSVISRLDAIVDKFVKEYGVGYFKFDYNIDVTQGTDCNADSSGDGMLEHRRAYISWIDGIYDRFPDIVLESCSSGAQRLDYHMLATHSIQSTSDQQDPLLYSAISAAAPTAVTPEQSASWAFPQPEYSDELNALCVVNSMMGRVHLSGRIDLLSEHQLKLVIEGMSIYKEIRPYLRSSLPFWPLGLHKWHQPWLVLGLRCKDRCYLAIWRRGGEEECHISLSDLKGRSIEVRTLYPAKLQLEKAWAPDTGMLSIKLSTSPAARLLYIAC